MSRAKAKRKWKMRKRIEKQWRHMMRVVFLPSRLHVDDEAIEANLDPHQWDLIRLPSTYQSWSEAKPQPIADLTSLVKRLMGHV